MSGDSSVPREGRHMMTMALVEPTRNELCLERLDGQVVEVVQYQEEQGGSLRQSFTAPARSLSEFRYANVLLELLAEGAPIYGRTPELAEAVREWLTSSGRPDLFALVQEGVPSWAKSRRAPSQTSPAGDPLMADPSPLVAPRIRSRKMLAPPTMQILFNACGSNDKSGFTAFIDGNVGGMQYANGKDALQLRHPEDVPLDLRNANIEREALEAWARAGVRRDLERLDAIAWDVAALAVTAFYARTKAETVDSRFPLMIDDYLDWRNVDPRKRSDDLRQEVLDRLRLVCSERFHVFSETSLHLPNPETGRKKRQSFVVKGPFLVHSGDLFRNGQRQLQLEGMGQPDGVLLSLGEWARKFVEEKAMLGLFLKRLAEYDLRRQQWERRIGWYLVFQMQNMASKSKWKTGKNGAVMVTPQHALKMRTVLDGSRVDWEELSQVNPGRLIKYWTDALETLRQDAILGEYRCLDGVPDGSDLPKRGRLERMLDRRWIFIPGPELSKHLQPKRAAAEKGQKAAARLKEKRDASGG